MPNRIRRRRADNDSSSSSLLQLTVCKHRVEHLALRWPRERSYEPVTKEHDGVMTARTMRSWRGRTPGPMSPRPLELVTDAVADPADGELLVAVRACGV